MHVKAYISLHSISKESSIFISGSLNLIGSQKKTLIFINKYKCILNKLYFPFAEWAV